VGSTHSSTAAAATAAGAHALAGACTNPRSERTTYRHARQCCRHLCVRLPGCSSSCSSQAKPAARRVQHAKTHAAHTQQRNINRASSSRRASQGPRTPGPTTAAAAVFGQCARILLPRPHCRPTPAHCAGADWL
jgi:hypothetical protein